MSCDQARKQEDRFAKVFLKTAPVKQPVVVAFVHIPSNTLIVPVRWFPNYFQRCDSWTFDRLTWMEGVAPKQITIAHFHRRGPKGMKHMPEMTYRIVVTNFTSSAHSSFDCSDPDQRHPEKLHCPRSHFAFDREAEEQPAPGPLQEALL